MKRLLIMLCVALALTGCSAWDGGEESASPGGLADRPVTVEEGSSSSADLELYDPWGIALTVKDVTPTGLTVVCTQSGGKDVAQLQSGQYYRLEELHGDHWHECEGVSGRCVFTTEAWIIPMEDSMEWPVQWTEFYGQLAPGTYRIVKEIMNFRGTGDYDTVEYSAEFMIG